MRLPLKGCQSTPLSGYLKALGVIRLVSQQMAPEIQGFWEGNHFVLLGIDEEQTLVDFFLQKYAPTPLVAPWNGGSGFFPNDDKSSIHTILENQTPRFTPYISVIQQILGWKEIPSPPESVAKLLEFLQKEAVKKKGTKDGELLLQEIREIENIPPIPGDRNPLEFPVEKEKLERIINKKNAPETYEATSKWRKNIGKGLTVWSKNQRELDKNAILNACRARLPEGTLDWFDAVYALTENEKPLFAPILGSGANDGRLELTNNFMKRITDVLITIPPEKSEELLRASLFAHPSKNLTPGKIGFYDPGRAGGYNQGMGIEKKDFSINPWDYVLLFEGLPTLAASVSRKSGQFGSFISAPFTTKHTKAGYASEGNEKNRNETWLPLWGNPAGFEEIRFLFREGRSTVRHRISVNSLDFVRSLGTLGVDRGIQHFQRYVYLERRGNNYVALPANIVSVKERREIHILDEVDPILRSVDMFMQSFRDSVPKSLETARKNIDTELFSCAKDPSPSHFRNLVRAFGTVEKLVAQAEKKPTKPFCGLSSRWIALCREKSTFLPEVFLAGALSSVGPSGKVGSLRAYLSGTDSQNPYVWGKDKNRFWHGIDMEERMCRLVLRRQLDAGRLRAPLFPVHGSFSLNPGEIVPFLEKRTDDTLLEDLLWGFLWIDWRKKKDAAMYKRTSPEKEFFVLPRIWALIKLCHSSRPLEGNPLPPEPRIANLLFAGRLEEAERQAKFRLRGSGYIPLSVTFTNDLSPTRILASLLFPLWEDKRIAGLVLEKRNES